MNFQHKQLATGKWNQLSLVEQLANIGSEVMRAIKWRRKGNQAYSQAAFYRALELTYLTKNDPKHRHTAGLKELCRLYECLVDYFAGENIYGSSDVLWENYFIYFSRKARQQ